MSASDPLVSAGSTAVEPRVLELVGALVAELRQSPSIATVTPDDSLERDLGLHSLERLELLLRLERAFAVHLDEAIVLGAERPADLVAAIVAPGSFTPNSAATWVPSRHEVNPGDQPRPPAGSIFFTAYVLILLLLTAPLVRLALLVLPAGPVSERIIRWYARRVFAACGCRLQVSGLAHLRRSGPAVLVANHSSYLDGFALVAALPIGPRLVVKEGLTAYPLIGGLLGKFRHLAVDRTSVGARVAAAARMVEALRHGDSLVVFPEGTFSRSPALLPFRLGAFSAAVESGHPVVPVAVRGTRSILHYGRWLLRRGEIHITIGAPLCAAGGGWRESVQLRQRVRGELERVLEADRPAVAAMRE